MLFAIAEKHNIVYSIKTFVKDIVQVILHHIFTSMYIEL